jgi:hypothetical protein
MASKIEGRTRAAAADRHQSICVTRLDRSSVWNFVASLVRPEGAGTVIPNPMLAEFHLRCRTQLQRLVH